MTENMAGRGEGLAGLVAKWRELKGRYLRTVPSSCGCRQDEDIAKARVFSDCADELETALEAAARLPAAHEAETRLLDTLTELLSDRELVIQAPSQEWDSRWADVTHALYERRENPKWAAALATPSPQAPRPDCELLSSPNSVLAFDAELNPEQEEQSNVFSTTSAREQSSATASSSPSAVSFVKWARVVIQQLLTGIVFTPETKQNKPLMEFVEDAHEFMHETVPAATQEPPAGSALQWNIEQILVYIWQCIGGEASDPKEYPYSQFAESEGGKLLRSQIEGLAGSPRKVGEDGALKADDYRLVPVRLVQRFGANVPGNESDTRWTVCLPNGDYAHLFPEYLLSRPSSVPVGEQKQEEGV